MTRHPVEDLTALVDGALAPAPRVEVEAHVASCASCRAERDRIAATVARLRAMPPAPEPRPGFEARFHARLAAERAARRPGWFARVGWRRLAPGLAVAAAAAAVVVHLGGVRRAEERTIAEHLELFEDYELVASLDAVEGPEDLRIAAHLDELRERRP